MLRKFVTESNKIEGIIRPPTHEEVEAHRTFIYSPEVTVQTLQTLVSVCAPGHLLRDREGLNVRVGDHVAPVGGPAIREELHRLVTIAHAGAETPHEVHCKYEDLHPFTDGNGRSGRALWYWMMVRLGGRDMQMADHLGFLHTFYYQTLSASDARKG